MAALAEELCNRSLVVAVSGSVATVLSPLGSSPLLVEPLKLIVSASPVEAALALFAPLFTSHGTSLPLISVILPYSNLCFK